MESALAQLTSRPDDFADQWPAKPEVHHGDPVAASALLDLDDLDRLIGDQGLPGSSITMAKDDVMARPGSLLKPEMAAFPDAAGALDARRVGARLREGHTLLLMGLHHSWRPISDFCRLLCSELGHPLYAHAFLTPPKSQGFAHHWDTEAVFILQTAGHKTWEVHEPAFQDPLPKHRWGHVPVSARERTRYETGEPFLRVHLSPGDALWIPRGWVHNGYAEEDSSLHISLGIRQLTRHWVLEKLLDVAAEDPEFRVALPPSLNQHGVNGSIAGVTERFARWLADLDVERVAPTVRADQLRAQSGPRRPAISSAVRPPDRVDGAVRYVPGSVLAVTERDDGLVLHLGDRDLRLPSAAADVIAPMIGRRCPPRTVDDLAASLGGEGARRLIDVLFGEGVLAPADRPGAQSDSSPSRRASR